MKVLIKAPKNSDLAMFTSVEGTPCNEDKLPNEHLVAFVSSPYCSEGDDKLYLCTTQGDIDEVMKFKSPIPFDFKVVIQWYKAPGSHVIHGKSLNEVATMSDQDWDKKIEQADKDAIGGLLLHVFSIFERGSDSNINSILGKLDIQVPKGYQIKVCKAVGATSLHLNREILSGKVAEKEDISELIKQLAQNFSSKNIPCKIQQTKMETFLVFDMSVDDLESLANQAPSTTQAM